MSGERGLAAFKLFCEKHGGEVKSPGHWTSSQGYVEQTGEMYGAGNESLGYSNNHGYETLVCHVKGMIMEMSQEVQGGTSTVSMEIESKDHKAKASLSHFADEALLNDDLLFLYKNDVQVATVKCEANGCALYTAQKSPIKY